MSKKEWPSVDCITVGDLKRLLAAHHDDSIIDFSGLEFYRLKMRGESLVQVEFSEVVQRDLKSGLVMAESVGGPRSMRTILPGVE